MKRSKIYTQLNIAGTKEQLDQRITIAMAAVYGHVPSAAKLLGISERTLYRLIKKRKEESATEH